MERPERTISVKGWADFLGSEYLASFIKDGGASVKFAVAADGARQSLSSALAAQSRNLGAAFVKINAVDTRVHMPQDLFFAISRQVDWRLAARRVIVQLARDKDYDTARVDPAAPDNIYASIGETNSLDRVSILQDLRVAIRDKVARNRGMSRDFRVAMSHLCLAEATDSGEYKGQPLLEWLTGENTRISNVQHFQVRTPINRTTARYFMESLLYWIRYAGYAGSVIFLDNARVTLSNRPADGSRFYSKLMVIDHYELLRELIDSADRLNATLVVVASSPEFLDETSGARGFGVYPALMTRVMNDVRDKNLVNPMASLVRLS